MGRHSLWHMDVVSVAVVGVHSVGVWRRTLMRSSARKGKHWLNKEWFTNGVLSFTPTLVLRILTLGAASSCASGPPSSAESHVDGAFAQRLPVLAYGVAGSGGP